MRVKNSRHTSKKSRAYNAISKNATYTPPAPPIPVTDNDEVEQNCVTVEGTKLGEGGDLVDGMSG